jgi:hypothetical protein
MNGPGYWMNEASGVLRPAVEAYLQGHPMSRREIGAMQAYLRQWIMSPVWNENPHGGHAELAGLRDLVNSLTTQAQISLWLHRAMDLGIDPL